MQHHATGRSGLSPSSGTSSTGTVVHRSKVSGSKRSPPGEAGPSSSDNNNTIKSDFKTKTVLKEAVDAVVSSFAKHSQGYGRGIYIYIY